jgi:hypothetical protein
MLVPYALRITYLVELSAVIVLDVTAFAVALLLAIWPPFRQTARRIAGGVIGSLPFLLFFQGLSLPLLGAIAAVPLVLGLWPDAIDIADLIAANVGFTLTLAVFVIASVTGFATGWGVGARVASGTPVRDALRASRVLTFVTAGMNRLLPLRPAATPERGLAIGLAVILLTTGALVLARMAYLEANGSDEMDYRGEKIRLAKKYVDYDDYKNDPANLAASEIPRVERMMTDARIGRDFASWLDVADQLNKIKFPGYGMGPGPNVVAVGREFVVKVIEMPQVAKDRYFVLEKLAGGTFRLADDFVASQDPRSAFAAISSIRLVDDRLVYSDRSGKVVRETPTMPSAR